MIVYKATNKINNKVYIGITTKTLEHRKRIHIRDSKTKDTYFYRALRKYGENNFEWEIIDSAETMEELEELERYYINLYDSFNNKKKGYNSTSGGYNLYEITDEERRNRSKRAKGENNPMYGVESPMKGKHFTEEHKSKISNALKKSYRPHVVGGSNPSAKRVINLDTKEIFETLTDASKKYGISRQMIGKVCNGHNKTAKGFRWAFIEDGIVKHDELCKSKNKCKIKVTHKITGETYIFKSIRSCAKQLKLNREAISLILKGQKKNNYDYEFEYIN
nr:MAG TPA: intron associated endonuclease [Caudoviricetes sp.]